MMAAQMMQTEAAAARTLSRADYDRFLPLVRRTAMRLARRVPAEVTVADLVSYGWIGLIEAYRRAQPDMPENEFEAYALYRVKGAMLDYLRGLDPASRSTRKISRAIARAIAELSQKLGRAPEEEEICAELKMSEEQYRQALTDVAAAGMARLEMVQLDNMEVEADHDDSPDGRRLIASALVQAINTLPPRLQQVVALYYQEDCTLREIGQVLGVTESRVSQLHTEAIHRLRAAIGRE
ncbi:MAG TPA: RNA polymerase sigma factor FliA [Polyangiaceae bacterium]